MSRHVIVGLLLLLLGVAGIVAGALVLAADPPRQGAGLGLLFAGVAVDFVGLGVVTTGARRRGAQGNGGNVPGLDLSGFGS